LLSVDRDPENVYVSKTNELVLIDKNKALGHRALQIYYKQRPHSAQSQLITSLMQEHKRLAAIEQQQNTNISRKAQNVKMNGASKWE